MATILVTGYTGNVGGEVFKSLREQAEDQEILIAGRHHKPENPKHRYLDFEDPTTYAATFAGVDYLFLIRPPKLASVDEVFGPLIDAMIDQGVRGIVLLSVYGAESNRFLPHHAIEQAIMKSGLSYYFLRPTYFMQNLTTTLYDQVKTGRLELPAGRAAFNWIDVRDIGAAAARLLLNFPQHPNDRVGITLATYENLDFYRVAERSKGSSLAFDYQAVGLPRFIIDRVRAGETASYAATVGGIHLLQRLQKPVMARTDWRKLINRDPHTLREFFERQQPE